MDQNKLPKREIALLAVGEVLVGAIITAVYLLIGRFNYTVPLGALLGGAVTVFNFVFLSIAVNRAIDDAMKVYEARQAELSKAKLPQQRAKAQRIEIPTTTRRQNLPAKTRLK